MPHATDLALADASPLDRDDADPYWNRERELRDPAERDALTLIQLKKQLDYAYATLPLYRRLWDAHGFHPDQVTTLADFTQRCPVVTKKDLVRDQQEHPPFGSYLGVDRRELTRIQGSSGTTGTPTMYGISERDWRRGREIFAMTHWAMGARPTDTVLFAFPFGLFFGGWGMLYAAQSVGATVLPMGAAGAREILTMIDRMQVTVLEGTPSYMLHLAEIAREIGYDPAGSSVRRIMSGAEPGGSIPSTRQRIMEAWGLDSVCDSGTSSEMFPFCTNAECTQMNGMHVYSDEVWTEVVQPDDPHTAVPEGEIGNLVYTHLWRDSQPMIRFAVGDRTYVTHEPCPCGRTYPRMPRGLLGRADDTLVIRGANIYPAAVETALREVDGLGLEYRVRVRKEGELDEMSVEAEISPEAVAQGLSRADLERRAAEALKHHCRIRIPVSLVDPNSFERAAGKARRIIDERGAV